MYKPVKESVFLHQNLERAHEFIAIINSRLGCNVLLKDSYHDSSNDTIHVELSVNGKLFNFNIPTKSSLSEDSLKVILPLIKTLL
jgi:hypothetical protein